MDIKLLLLFIVLNVINVIIQTVKSLVTVKCGKVMASLVNALAYGLYTYIVIMTMCELPTFLKALIVAICNLIGVYVARTLFDKLKKDKLWLVKITIPKTNLSKIKEELDNISFTYFDLDKYYVLDCFCEKQIDTQKVLQLCKKYEGKAFATENTLY